MSPQPKLMTAANVARRWGLHESTVREKIAGGELPGLRIGVRYYVATAAVDAIERDAATLMVKPSTEPAPAELEVVK